MGQRHIIPAFGEHTKEKPKYWLLHFDKRGAFEAASLHASKREAQLARKRFYEKERREKKQRAKE